MNQVVRISFVDCTRWNINKSYRDLYDRACVSWRVLAEWLQHCPPEMRHLGSGTESCEVLPHLASDNRQSGLSVVKIANINTSNNLHLICTHWLKSNPVGSNTDLNKKDLGIHANDLQCHIGLVTLHYHSDDTSSTEHDSLDACHMMTRIQTRMFEGSMTPSVDHHGNCL